MESEYKPDKIYAVPNGADALYISARIHDSFKNNKAVVYIADDDEAYHRIIDHISFYIPDIHLIKIPAWDCLPYDRVSPSASVMAERAYAFSSLVLLKTLAKPTLIVTMVNAITQRVPPRALFKQNLLDVKIKSTLHERKTLDYLSLNGYVRTDTVREPGEFAWRGSLLDIFPAGANSPYRIDLFGDEIESIKIFDPLSQLTQENVNGFILYPVSEIFMTEANVTRFRRRYRELFGAADEQDALYQAVTESRKYAGMEHWLPLFYDEMETVFDYMPKADYIEAAQVSQAWSERQKQIDDFYQSRLAMAEMEHKTGSAYNPIDYHLLYLSDNEYKGHMRQNHVAVLTPHQAPEKNIGFNAFMGRDFSDIRVQDSLALYKTVAEHIQHLQTQGKKIIITAYSQGARERLKSLLEEHGIKHIILAQTWLTVTESTVKTVTMIVLPLEHGFVTPEYAFISEQDILGDRLMRPQKKRNKNKNFLRDVSHLHEGDFVVHQDHGIGQFSGLETITVDGISHDCLKLIYAGGDKLFVPVENLDVLSRYGGADVGAVLDKLGGAGWQSRKARVKRDLLAIANELMEIAAKRLLNKTEPIVIGDGSYERFSSGFPYHETEDQQKAIEDVLEDLSHDHAMDRLVCGDVGFGKTEIALRAAFTVARAGYQVAVVAPTTLLARQHFHGFMKRFHGFNLRINQLSRLITAKEMERAKREIEDGSASITIGTHALFSDGIKFKNLGLLIVDEEQRFGVKQKEKIKKLKENVHVLTLTATPIPRTLQLALAGVRELSLITTPPVDRLAVRTFVMPFDDVILREALMREHFRGGQSFYVVPRISDLTEIEERLRQIVPELKFITAQGQMTPTELEDRMVSFYEGQYDVLLSTQIIESGLDIPSANTMIIHRAEMFGLAQLYQLRGRIGRSKVRGYAYLTYGDQKTLTKTALQRLQVIEQLDSLGAGFQLASHDMDIRGSGNLLGEEQSGHIKEVGVELYQRMLEEAVLMAKSGNHLTPVMDQQSPQINLAVAVLIPEQYIPDLTLRLMMYRRLSDLNNEDDVDAFAAELIDRFGDLPSEVDNLLKIVVIKILCRKAQISRIDAGPKGAIISFYQDKVDYVDELIAYVQKQLGTVKMRPDQKISIIKNLHEPHMRIKIITQIVSDLAQLASRVGS